MKRAVILLSLLFAASSVVADVVVTMTGSLAYTGGISNIAVGDSYTLTLRYDPTQAPTSSETYPGVLNAPSRRFTATSACPCWFTMRAEISRSRRIPTSG